MSKFILDRQTLSERFPSWIIFWGYPSQNQVTTITIIVAVWLNLERQNMDKQCMHHGFPPDHPNPTSSPLLGRRESECAECSANANCKVEQCQGSEKNVCG